jgi:hypothetical protein
VLKSEVGLPFMGKAPSRPILLPGQFIKTGFIVNDYFKLEKPGKYFLQVTLHRVYLGEQMVEFLRLK